MGLNEFEYSAVLQNVNLPDSHLFSCGNDISMPSIDW